MNPLNPLNPVNSASPGSAVRQACPVPAARPLPAVRAVLFDRDGTLIEDVPYNGDPGLVRPVDGAREALDLLRERGIRTGVVTNQSGIARGLLTHADVRRVNARVDELLGPFDVWAVCPHGPDDGCHCRKPEPGLVLWAVGRVCTSPADCAVVGDIGADVEAAHRAGARAVLVPTPATRPEETAAAPHVAPDLLTAVRTLVGDAPQDHGPSEGFATGPGAAPGHPGGPAPARPAGGGAGRARPDTAHRRDPGQANTPGTTEGEAGPAGGRARPARGGTVTQPPASRPHESRRPS